MDQNSIKPSARSTFSWILYDFANTAYSMTVVSFYFSIWVVLELGQRDIYVSIANGLSMLLVAVTMPFLGDLSDYKNNKVKSLFLFTIICVIATAFLGVIGYATSNVAIMLPLLLLIYVIANYSFQAGLVYYNSLLPFVSTPKNMGRVSGYGTGIGYVGAIVGLAVASVFVDGNFFGIDIKAVNGDGTKAAFFSTAVLFLLFSIPIFLYVREPKLKKNDQWSLEKSFAKITKSLMDTKKHPGLARFLIGRLLYENGIQTIILFMGVYTQAVMGFTSQEAVQFFMVVIPSAIVGSIICGIMTDHFGSKRTLVAVLLMWFMSLIIVLFIADKGMFYLMGFLIGALMGTADTAARPLFISLVPKESMGEFFGLYAVSGKIAAVVGPFVWGAVTLGMELFGDVIKYKAAVSAMAIIMIIGTIVLFKVPDYHKKIKSEYVSKLT